MWLKNSKRRIFLDMHFPDWKDRQTATDFEPERIAQTFAEANVDSVILYAKCQYGNFYYDTQVGHKHSGLGSQDFFRETQEALRQKGIKVIAYYSVAWDERYARTHPHWRVRQEDGSVGTDEFRWSTLCINTAYREVVKDHLREIATQLQPDGYWIDMTIIGRGCCFCDACRQAFKEKYRHSLPEALREGDPLHSQFIQFRYDYIEAFYREIYQLLREIQPDAQLSNNYWGYPYSSHTMGSRACGALQGLDYITGEAYTDWTGLTAPGFFSRWLRCAGQGRPFEALISRFVGTWDYTVKPYNQLAQEAYVVAANGGTVTVDDMPYANGELDWELYKDIGAVYGEVKRREHLLCGDPASVGAIFHSQASKDAYFHGGAPFISSITGALRLMRELHLEHDFIFDETLKDVALKKYRFLLLPRVAIISEEQQKQLLTYIKEGGLVIAAGELAWQPDAQGVHAPLWEALKIRAEEMSSHEVSFITDVSPAIDKGVGKRPLTVRSPYIRYSGHDFEVLARVQEPICITSPDTFFHNNLPSPYQVTDYPAILQKRYGKGSLVLFAQDVFAQFATYHQAGLKKLFSNILDHHAVLPDVRFHCPSSVETVVQQENGKLILHLVNMTSGMTMCTGTMDTFEGRYQRTFEFIEDMVPLGNLSISFPNAARPPQVLQAMEVGSDAVETRVEPNGPGAGYVLHLKQLERWVTLVIKL